MNPRPRERTERRRHIRSNVNGVLRASLLTIAAAGLVVGGLGGCGGGSGKSRRAGGVIGEAGTGTVGVGGVSEPMVMTPSLINATTAGADIRWVLRPGATNVVVVDPNLVSSGRGVEIRLDDGRVLPTSVHAVRVMASAAEDASDPASVAARAGWWLNLGVGGRRQVWSSGPFKPGEAGAAVLTVDVPAEAPSGSKEVAGALHAVGATSAGPRVTIHWAATTSDEKMEGVFAPGISEHAWESAWMRASLLMAESSPLTRWRSLLARGVLLDDGAAGAKALAGVRPFGDPVIEGLARSVESQWLAALSKLAARDAALARKVIVRLCASVDAGGGIVVPAWAPEGPQLAALLEGLMDPRPAHAEAVARGWLADAPSLLCWVIDDAGAGAAATGAASGTVGVANLSDEPLAAWIEPMSGADSHTPEILPVTPWTVRRVSTAPGMDVEYGRRPAGVAASTALKGVRVNVRVVDRVFTPTLYSEKAPALAPGVVIGPFHADWRLGDWLAAGQDMKFSTALGPWSDITLADTGWTTTGQVYRGVDVALEQGASSPDRWLVYVESKDGGSRSAAAEAERLRVWFGPFGRSNVVLTVLADGRVIDESPPSPDAGRPTDVPRLIRVTRTADGWACWLPVPVSVIDRQGTLRIGVERMDARGVRTSWPRPSFPWQQEPSRVVIDTSLWQSEK